MRVPPRGRNLADALGRLAAGCAFALALLLHAPAGAAPRFEVLWKARTAPLAPLAWKPRRQAEVVLARDGRAVFVGHAAGLMALRADTGALLWQAQTGDPVDATPLERDGRVWAVDTGGALQAYDRNSGVPLWKEAVALDVAVRAGLRADAARLFLSAESGTLYALAPDTGRVQWRRRMRSGREFLAEGNGAPLVHGDMVVAGASDGQLVVVSTRDGGVVWARDLSGTREGQPDVDTTPVLVGPKGKEMVLAASHRAGLYALRLADGDQRWHRPGEGYSTPVVEGERCYTIDGSHALWVLRWRDGEPVAARRMASEPTGAIALHPAGLLVPTGSGITLVRRSDLGTRARLTDPYGFAAAPTVVGEAIWAIANDGTVYAMRIHP